MDTVVIYDCQHLACLWRELCDFGCWVLRKVSFALQCFNCLLVPCIATIQAVKEWTLSRERYKLQLRECLVFLILVLRIRRLRRVICQLIICLFLNLLLRLLVRVAFVSLPLLLIWVVVTRITAVEHLRERRLSVAVLTTIAKTTSLSHVVLHT